jgi:nucleoside-diphosphate-sugar epimerase
VKALVTGGTGFVGSHLLESLLQRGDEVRALVRAPAKAEALGLSGVEWVRGDLSDAGALTRAAGGVDVVYHVAGVVAALDEAGFMAVNREGTRRVIEAAEAAGARLVVVSSLAAGGPAEAGRPRTEGEPSRPVTAYGRSKLAGEELVRASGIPWTIIRPPAVYGPRDAEMFRLFRAASLGVGAVFGEGDQELSLVYGPDLAEAIAAAGHSEATVGRTFYAAHPETIRSGELARTIGKAMSRDVRVIRIPVAAGRAMLQVTGAVAKLAGRPTILTPDKGNELFQPAWTCDPTALTDATGWRATHDILAGARRTAEWYRERGWL